MAANKFENNIKKIMEERQIQPSANAWSQLSNSLDKADKKTTPVYMWFLGIAASIIGLLFVVNSFQPFQNIENSATPSVVNSTSEIIIKNEIPSEEPPIKNTSEALVSTSEKESDNISEVKEAKISKKQTKSNVENKTETRVASANKSYKTQQLRRDLEEVNALRPINSITSPEKSAVEQAIANASLNNEVDALLSQAKNKLTIQDISNENTYSVNVNNLLQDVEMDIDQSFRDKVFQTIKENFKIVKTAVADRNN
ncbi:hypothetical protein [Bizionia myxarmorum]|uniref:Uncharacterized protein n=1 Tax=Bizionia myxarmorum TaxID=291186 RepID=A0A5D0RC17_9FLAO|nr:hypothetical protein [Bizionia myxarmorum]TYB78248.1 hypothetical protein ES674_00255 [Bizionia myxarmorum]